MKYPIKFRFVHPAGAGVCVVVMLMLYEAVIADFAYFWASALGVAVVGGLTGWSSVAHDSETMPRPSATSWIFLAIVAGIGFSRAISHRISAEAVVWHGACFFLTYIIGFALAVAVAGREPE